MIKSVEILRQVIRRPNSIGYSVSDLVSLVKIFSKFEVSENDAVIDIGCWKGAVISVLSRYRSCQAEIGLKFGSYFFPDFKTPKIT